MAKRGEDYINMDGDILYVCDKFAYQVELYEMYPSCSYALVRSNIFYTNKFAKEAIYKTLAVGSKRFSKECTLVGAPKEYLESHGYIIR